MERNKRTVAIGVQDFEKVITNDCFYVDKTKFIKEWWESGDSVTLITRPRRFGKTLIIEFKVRRPGKEADLEETVAAALRQIEEKHYEQELLSRGVTPEKIRKYGFAFEGKRVLIGRR